MKIHSRSGGRGRCRCLFSFPPPRAPRGACSGLRLPGVPCPRLLVRHSKWSVPSANSVWLPFRCAPRARCVGVRYHSRPPPSSLSARAVCEGTTVLTLAVVYAGKDVSGCSFGASPYHPLSLLEGPTAPVTPLAAPSRGHLHPCHSPFPWLGGDTTMIQGFTAVGCLEMACSWARPLPPLSDDWGHSYCLSPNSPHEYHCGPFLLSTLLPPMPPFPFPPFPSACHLSPGQNESSTHASRLVWPWVPVNTLCSPCARRPTSRDPKICPPSHILSSV